MMNPLRTLLLGGLLCMTSIIDPASFGHQPPDEDPDETAKQDHLSPAETIDVLLSTRDGVLRWSTVGQAIGDALYLDGESICRLLPAGDLRLGAPEVLMSLMAVEMATRGGIQFRPTRDLDGERALVIRCRRGKWLRRFPAKPARQVHFDIDDDWARRTGLNAASDVSLSPNDSNSDSGFASPLIVFLHGIRSDTDAFDRVRRDLRAKGFATAALGYDYEQSIADSATQVAQRFEVFLKKHPRVAAEVPVMLVGHSMGGLVARYWVDHPDLKSDPVQTLVTLGSPHLGSQWASLPPVLDMIGEDSFDAMGILSVVLHRPSSPGMIDLHPESEFIARLNRLEAPSGVRRISLAGTASPVPRSMALRIGDALRAQDQEGTVVRWMRPRIKPLVAGLREWSRGDGDGVVCTRSAKLPGADEHHVVPVSHFHFLTRSHRSIHPVWSVITKEAARLKR